MENKKIVVKGLATLNMRKNALNQAREKLNEYLKALKTGKYLGNKLRDDDRKTIGAFIKLYQHHIRILENQIKREEPEVQKQLDKINK